MEKHATLQDGELVLGPVPELPQVLVVQSIEGVISGEGHARLHEHIFHGAYNTWREDVS